MVYSPTGSSDLVLVLGCLTFNFLYSGASTFYFSYLSKTDTKISPPANPLERVKINKPPGGFLLEDLRVNFLSSTRKNTFVHLESVTDLALLI